LCHAATKIQASFRGHMIRKQMEKKENETDDSPQDKKNEVTFFVKKVFFSNFAKTAINYR
jgi:hypothetical protein